MPVSGRRLISIGEITSPHGVRGEVRVYPLTDFPGRFSQLKKVIINQNNQQRELTVESARQHRQLVILKFYEIDDADMAGALRKALIQVEQSDVIPLPQGHYYVFQLVGLGVYGTAGDYLGELVDVLQTSANDVYVVNRPADAGKLLIPALKQVVRNIDLEQGRMVVELLPGLEEL